MATAGVTSGTILAVHLQKCSHLSNLFASSFSIIKQLMPALAVNIIIVHPWDVVFPRENNTPRVYYHIHCTCNIVGIACHSRHSGFTPIFLLHVFSVFGVFCFVGLGLCLARH